MQGWIPLLLAFLIAVPDTAEARLLRRRACRPCMKCEPPRSNVAESVATAGFTTPEAAFRAYLLGGITDDYDLQLSSLTPKGRAWHIGLAIFSAQYLFGEDPEMQKLLREHAPDATASGERTSDELSEEEQERRIVEAMLKFKEPGKLMRAIMDKHVQLARKLELVKDDHAQTTPEQVLSRVRLKRLSYPTPDTAVAMIEITGEPPHNLELRTDEVPFRKIAGRWYCDIDPR